jgi:hypothetical protein
MPVDRKFWSYYSFTKQYCKPFPCPTCGRGILKVQEGTLFSEWTAYTRKYRKEDPNWEPECDQGRCSCRFVCGNDSCRDVVAAAGRVDTGCGETPEQPGYYCIFGPEFFTPSVKIIPIPDQCPTDVAAEIELAFQVFFSDFAGAINHLRKSVECILDYLDIPRQQMVTDKKTGKKRKRIRDLHNRIAEFRKKDPTLADRLEAIKWIGNRGSHSSRVKADDVFDALDLVEDFIYEHFEKKGKRIVALTQKIIKRKGPLGH